MTEGDEGPGPRPYKGRTDVPLSREGEQQVRAAAGLIESLGAERGVVMEALYTSTLKRAVRSAELIGERLALSPRAVPELVERDFGLWEGMTYDEIRARYSGAFEAWAADPLGHKPSGGESTLEVSERVVPAIGKILKAHPGGAVGVVAHGGVNRVVLCHYLGVPLENIFRFEQDHAAVSVIDFYDGTPVLRLMNLTAQAGKLR